MPPVEQSYLASIRSAVHVEHLAQDATLLDYLQKVEHVAVAWRDPSLANS